MPKIIFSILVFFFFFIGGCKIPFFKTKN
jgi:hypothetical protein